MVFLVQRVCPLCNEMSIMSREESDAGFPCRNCQMSHTAAQKDMWLSAQNQQTIEERLEFIENWLYDHMTHIDPHNIMSLLPSIFPNIQEAEIIEL